MILEAPPVEFDHNAGYWRPSFSDDGRYLAFQTPIALDPRDQNLRWDVYVHDRSTRRIQMASVSSNEEPAARTAQRDGTLCCSTTFTRGVDLTPAISPDGRLVMFRSNSDNLVGGDTNRTWDTFIRDLVRGTTERVSVSGSGEQADGPSIGQQYVGASFSQHGRYVVFDSLASNLGGSGDTPGTVDAYLRDRLLGTTTRIDRIVPPTPGDIVPSYTSISRNGRFITYTTWSYTEEAEDCEDYESFVEFEPDGEVLVGICTSARATCTSTTVRPT